MAFSIWNRKLHRWGAVVVALPLAVIVTTGVLLQLKKHADWVQPPTRKGTERQPRLTMEAILAAASTASEARIASWDDVDRLDVRPRDGIVKVQARNRWEVQVDASSGAVLQVAYRRSDVIEALHDGSWFHDGVKLGVFLPAGIVLLGLWITGIYLWFLPHWVKRRRDRMHAGVGPDRDRHDS